MCSPLTGFLSSPAISALIESHPEATYRDVQSLAGFVKSGENFNLLRHGDDKYQKALKRYCREAGVREVATHGLRHSTSEVYMHHGATRDDLRMLFAHCNSSVTDRYVHDRGGRLSQVAEVIQLFPGKGLSPKFPQRPEIVLDEEGVS